ncbi:hypothetical protein HQ487_01495 [Candidatus Uhrbacteria bacterium]|nr:hypothetical protein [Candidatus Uhrbacteria bacterium]
MKIALSHTQLDWLGRIAIFIIFFWFGFLKILMLSPADELTEALQLLTLPFFNFSSFFVVFGLFEMLIGVLFLVPKMSKIVIVILLFHMFTTFLPLLLLPHITWSGFMIPTLVGQYIIKNISLIALALLVTLHTDSKKELYVKTV